MIRALSCLFLGMGIALAAPVPDAKEPVKKNPSIEEIKQAIDELGSKRFVVRDKAKKFLMDAGALAEPLLKEAAKNPDEEIASSAKSILERFEWGLYPDTPQPIRELIEQFRAGSPEERQNAIAALMRMRNVPLPTLQKLVAKEQNQEIREQMLARMHQQVRETIPSLLRRGDFDAAEGLFDLILSASPAQIGQDYAVFSLLRGKLDPAIARFEKIRNQKDPEGERAAEMLVYLYRLKDDWASAKKAAEQSKKEDLVDRVLWRSYDWKGLAEAGRPPEFGPFLPVGAAYDRLSGNLKDCKAKIAQLKQAAEDQDEDWVKLRMDANALLLNGHANDAIKILADKKREMAFTFDLLCAQMRHKEAFALVDEARRRDTEKSERNDIEIRRARMLYLLGDKDSANQLFKKVAEEIKSEQNFNLVRSLIKTEARVGLIDLAAEHAAMFMSDSARPEQRVEGATQLLEPIFGDNKDSARIWWQLFRKELPDEEPVLAMKRVRSFLNGKAERKQVDEWVAKLDRKGGSNEANGEPRSRQGPAQKLEAIAATYRAFKDDETAEKYLLRAADDTRQHDRWTKLGDFYLETKQYPKAADAYEKAANAADDGNITIEIDEDSFRQFEARSSALPTYLRARALILAGNKKEGERLAEAAHWIPLGNEIVRANLVEELNKHGWPEMAKKEADFLLKTGWYSHYSYGNVLSFLARQAAKDKDYLTSADYYEKCLVGCLRTGANFIEPTAYLLVPESVRVYRSRGLLAKGKFDEALQEANANLEVMPGNIDLAIKLVPDLEKLGRKKEADAIYEKVKGVWEKLCADHPNSAFAHNSAAWVMANCKRDLDAALKHALKANEVEPKSAGYLDTLAEVYFRKGERDKALKLMKQCVELDPKHGYFRKQLTRFKDQAFDSPTPDEGEEE